MKYKGFTLAEVLITLVIIGVVAAMTIPTLMNNTNSEEFRSALKKAISTTNQALSLNFALDGLTAQDYTSNEDLVENLFKKRMNTIDDGGNSVFTNGCEGGKTFTTIDGTIFCVSSDFLSDVADTPTSPCNYQNTIACIAGGEGPNLWIDVNGEKKPNKLTLSSDHPRDIYTAQIFAQKVVPYGAPTQGVMYNKTVSTNKDEEDNSNNEGETTPDVNTPETPDVNTPETPDVNNPETPDVNNPETPDVNNPDITNPEENVKPNDNEESLKDKQDKLEEEKKQKEEEKNNLDQALKDIEDELAWLEKEEERLEEEEDRLEDKYDNVEDKLEDAEREAQKKKLQEQLNKIKEKIEENERQQDIIEDRQDVLEEEQERIEEEQERIEEELEKIEKEQNKLEQESQKDPNKKPDKKPNKKPNKKNYTESKPG